MATTRIMPLHIGKNRTESTYDLTAVYRSIIIGHNHAVFQQIDITILYARQSRHTFLHP